MAQENVAANGNGQLAEERQEAERLLDPQPDPFLVELVSRLMQEAVEARKRTEEEEREQQRREALATGKEVLQREETPQRPSPSPRCVRYNLD